MADKIDAQIPEVVGRQLGQDRGIDGVVAKRLLVLPHPEAVEPGCDIHARLPARPCRSVTIPVIFAERDCITGLPPPTLLRVRGRGGPR